MTTPTALALIDKLRHTPEVLEAIRQQLNIEANDTTSLVEKPKSNRPDNTQRDAEIVAKVHAGTHTRADIAREYQLSLPRINQIMQLHPNPNPVKVNPHAERNRLILDEARKKVPRAVIAKKYGLSVIRINQIVGAEPKVKKLTRAERTAEALRKYDAFEALTFEDDCFIMLAKYEPTARAITQAIVDGMTPKLTHTWEYPEDCTGGDIKWTPEHYEAIANIMYDFDAGIWKM